MVYVAVLVRRLLDCFAQRLDRWVVHGDLGRLASQVVVRQVVAPIAYRLSLQKTCYTRYKPTHSSKSQRDMNIPASAWTSEPSADIILLALSPSSSSLV